MNNITVTLESSKTPSDIFNCLKDIPKWWSEDFEGHSEKLNDEFIINHPQMHYSKQRIVELVPDKRIVWMVTESTLSWLKKDQQEWTNTKMVFDITSSGDKSILHFTHEGLTPEMECFSMVEKGWTIIIKDWLNHYINYGTQSEDMQKAAEIRDKILSGR